MSYFKNLKSPGIKNKKGDKVARVPDGLWVKCPSCGEILQNKLLAENLYVCMECDHHFRVSARDRIRFLTNDAKFTEYGQELRSSDPLNFSDLKTYKERLDKTIDRLGMNDAFVCGTSEIARIPVEIGAFEFKFMGGSMGSVVGEKITLLLEHALKKKHPAIVVSASGGARMQESILSLMQMAKTSALVAELKKAGIPYISILSDPTTGGVAASFAMLGDVIIAEPKALIGFAGPRVIEQTIRQKLPEGFQRAEFLLKQGFVDRVEHRKDIHITVAAILKMLTWNKQKKKKSTTTTAKAASK